MKREAEFVSHREHVPAEPTTQLLAGLQRSKSEVEAGLIRTVKGTNDHLVRPRMKELTVPTLLVGGREDKIVDPKEGERAIREVPDGNGFILTISRCGHAPQIEKARLLNRLVVHFLTAHAPVRPPDPAEAAVATTQSSPGMTLPEFPGNPAKLSARRGRGPDWWLMLRKFVAHGTSIASFSPSSRFLSRSMLKGIDWARAKVVVSSGPGPGRSPANW